MYAIRSYYALGGDPGETFRAGVERAGDLEQTGAEGAVDLGDPVGEAVADHFGAFCQDTADVVEATVEGGGDLRLTVGESLGDRNNFV